MSNHDQPKKKQRQDIALPEKVQVDRNLEKWPQIFAPAHAKVTGPRTYKREEKLTHQNLTALRSVTIEHVSERGTLTTEDSKTVYALTKIFHKRKKDDPNFDPKQGAQASFTELCRERLTRNNQSQRKQLKQSLRRLNRIAVTFTNSFYSKSADRYLDVETGGTILAGLSIVRLRGKDQKTSHEKSVFRFNEPFLNDLLDGTTIPRYVDDFLITRGEIAFQTLRYLELIMATKEHVALSMTYLFGPKGLDIQGTYASNANRAKKLEKSFNGTKLKKTNTSCVVTELVGKHLSTGKIIDAHIIPTKDGKDYKLIVTKKPYPKPSLSTKPKQNTLRVRATYNIADEHAQELIERIMDATGDSNRSYFEGAMKSYSPMNMDTALGQFKEETQLRLTDKESGKPIISNGKYLIGIARRLAIDQGIVG